MLFNSTASACIRVQIISVCFCLISSQNWVRVLEGSAVGVRRGKQTVWTEEPKNGGGYIENKLASLLWPSSVVTLANPIVPPLLMFSCGPAEFSQHWQGVALCVPTPERAAQIPAFCRGEDPTTLQTYNIDLYMHYTRGPDTPSVMS